MASLLWLALSVATGGLAYVTAARLGVGRKLSIAFAILAFLVVLLAQGTVMSVLCAVAIVLLAFARIIVARKKRIESL